MKVDTNFLCQSHISQHILVSEKSDPFVVYGYLFLSKTKKECKNLAPNDKQEKLKGIIDKAVVPLDKNIIRRIKTCEIVILEESVKSHIANTNKNRQ